MISQQKIIKTGETLTWRRWIRMCAVTSATLICCTTGDYADCEDLGAVDWMLLKAVGQRHHVNTLHSATPLDATERCGPVISSECSLPLPDATGRCWPATATLGEYSLSQLDAAERCWPAISSECSLTRPDAAERCWPGISGEYSVSTSSCWTMLSSHLRWIFSISTSCCWKTLASNLGWKLSTSTGSVDEHSGAAMDGVPHNCCNDSDNAQLPGDHDIASTPTPDGD